VAAWAAALLTCLGVSAASAMVGEPGVGDSASICPVADGRPDVTRRGRYAVPEDSLYKSPVNLLLTPDGRRLLVACEGTGEVLVVDVGKRRVVGQVAVGREPFGLAVTADSRRLYVGGRDRGEVVVVDLARLAVVQRFPVGDDPHHMVLSRDDRRLYVANLGTSDVSVVDIAHGTEEKRLSTGVGPFGVALSPDAASIWVSTQFSLPVPFRTPPVTELSVIDAARQLVRDRRPLRGALVGQGLALTPDGSFSITAVELPKNLVPETQVYQGWMVTYALAFTETRPGGRTAYLLLDEPNSYYADPYAVVISPDGRRVYVSSSGADAVTVVDLPRALGVLRVKDGRLGINDDEAQQFARHLALSTEYVVGRIATGATGANPKGLALSRDGRWLWVANRLDDQVAVIDTRTQQVVDRVDLGGPRVVSQVRAGAKLFNYASISFQRQMSCTTCHPEYGADGLSYDIAVDGGMGHNLVDNLTLRGIAETAPFKWTGKNPTLERQEGPRAAQLFFRTHGFDLAQNQEIVRFIESIPPRPNRYRLQQDQGLGDHQAMGRRYFVRGYDSQGRYIPVANRCVTCHPTPLGTDRKIHNVGSQAYHDRGGDFDTPHLLNSFERPPFMHDGRCYSLEEIWTRFNPYDTHGVTNEMSKDQLNALIDYIRTF
jgi:YVTN family beta-propeller protein